LAQQVGRAITLLVATSPTATAFSALAEFGQQSRLIEQQYAFFMQQVGLLIASLEPVSIAPATTKVRATWVNMD